MNLKSLHNILILAGPILLGGCAASQMHGFENAYQGYSVPEPLVEQIRLELKRVGDQVPEPLRADFRDVQEITRESLDEMGV